MTGNPSQAWWTSKLKRALRSGAIVPVLLMLPNVAWMLLYSPDMDVGTHGTVPAALAIAENVSRIAALALPFFYPLDLKRAGSTLVLIGMASALAIYYAAWGRFFMGGGAVALLSAPLLAIPAPLALAPVAFLMISSYLMRSWLMLGVASCFGVLHVGVLSVSGP